MGRRDTPDFLLGLTLLVVCCTSVSIEFRLRFKVHWFRFVVNLLYNKPTTKRNKCNLSFTLFCKLCVQYNTAAEQQKLN